MALIKCPECGKEVSDVASKCVNCGFPLNQSDASNQEKSNNMQISNQALKIIEMVVSALIILWIGLYLLDYIETDLGIVLFIPLLAVTVWVNKLKKKNSDKNKE